MSVTPKRVPRLWCALQGLLPLESCLDAQLAELALPPETAAGKSSQSDRTLNHVAATRESVKRPMRVSLRNQN